ncbi:MAG: efflux RND transporter permease subunit, partial [Pontibacterium sp.]
RFLSAGHGKQRWYHRGINTPWLARPFKASVRLGLKVPVLTLLLALALPAAGIWGAGQLKEQFFPPSDRDMFQIQVFMPSQSSLAHTQSAVEAINQELAKYPELTQINWFIGGNAPAFYYNLAATQQGAKNFAQAMITADSFISANRLVPVLQAALDNTQPDAQILVRRLEQGPPFNAPVELRIFGPNLDKLKALGDELRLVLSQTEDVLHTRATLVPGTPKVWVDINPNQAAISGLSLVEISNQLNHMLYGATGGTVLEVNESIPVRVTLPNNQKESIEALGNLQLVSPSLDHPIPLSSVAELKLAPSRGAIARRDGERINTIEGYITAGVLPAVVLERVTQRLDEINFTLPSGYRLEVGGESAERNDAVGNLLSSVGLIVALLITVLVLSFNSYRLCALILATASLSAALGLLSVYVFNYPFGFTVIIGLLGLMGLAINAAIVILAELKADTKAIEGDDQAIIDAVSSCTRHITSTTITTVGGFMPLILAEGNFWPPFAVAIAGGTVLTTLLSFYFVPAAFKLLTRIRRFELTGGGAAKLAADG